MTYVPSVVVKGSLSAASTDWEGHNEILESTFCAVLKPSISERDEDSELYYDSNNAGIC